MKELAVEEEAAVIVDYQRQGSAVDVVAVVHQDETLACSEWGVRFYVGILSSWRSRPLDFDEELLILVNDRVVDIDVRLDNEGYCIFGSRRKPAADELAKMSLRRGVNSLRVECGHQVAEARIFLWTPEKPVVVCDVDGTITRTDVRGFVDSVVADSPTVAHAGVCRFFASLDANIVYLTSRPIAIVDLTRGFLKALTQHGVSMPDGPLLTSRDNIIGALYTELVSKAPDVFKTRALLDVAAAYGRRATPFKAGFGNKTTDYRAYARAGVPHDAIFSIDPDSKLRLPLFTPSPVYMSYTDPALIAHFGTLLVSSRHVLRPVYRPPGRSTSL